MVGNSADYLILAFSKLDVMPAMDSLSFWLAKNSKSTTHRQCYMVIIFQVFLKYLAEPILIWDFYEISIENMPVKHKPRGLNLNADDNIGTDSNTIHTICTISSLYTGSLAVCFILVRITAHSFTLLTLYIPQFTNWSWNTSINKYTISNTPSTPSTLKFHPQRIDWDWAMIIKLLNESDYETHSYKFYSIFVPLNIFRQFFPEKKESKCGKAKNNLYEVFQMCISAHL